MTLHIEIRGLRETQAELERVARDLDGPPMVQGMRDATLLVEGDAKRNLVGYQSPSVGGVDTGRLRASITPQVESRGKETIGIVGSNVRYALWVEEPTRPHWPPLAALETWARRHGTTAYIVARAIARRGTIGKHFLQRAFDANRERIIDLLGNVVGRIVG
jgi:hypothetical protein